VHPTVRCDKPTILLPLTTDFTAFAESILPLVFFVDGRAKSPIEINEIGGGINIVFAANPIQPGVDFSIVA
jgi:hypothetical protein